MEEGVDLISRSTPWGGVAMAANMGRKTRGRVVRPAGRAGDAGQVDLPRGFLALG